MSTPAPKKIAAPDPVRQAADAFIAAQVREAWAAGGDPANRSKPDLGVRCPKCRARVSRVLYTRHRPALTRRFRVCLSCGRRFRTSERAD